ncbi:MAG: hypothetical protein ACM31O_15090 [Bacteroidota bacterium]|jgi:hypothetical protein
MGGQSDLLKAASGFGNNQGAQGQSGALATKAETAEYLTHILLELREMAAKGGLETLSGVLEIAYREAQSQACST